MLPGKKYKPEDLLAIALHEVVAYALQRKARGAEDILGFELGERSAPEPPHEPRCFLRRIEQAQVRKRRGVVSGLRLAEPLDVELRHEVQFRAFARTSRC